MHFHHLFGHNNPLEPEKTHTWGKTNAWPGHNYGARKLKLGM